jgi:hypothetical protein
VSVGSAANGGPKKAPEIGVYRLEVKLGRIFK